MKGLTLIELILSLAIIGIVIAATAAVLDLGLNSWRRYEERGELMQNGRIAMHRIIEELRYANAQSVVYSSGSLSFDTIYMIDTDSGIESLQYNLTNNTLYRCVDGGTQRAIAASIDTFAITSTATGLYEIELGLTGGDNHITLRNMAYPRN